MAIRRRPQNVMTPSPSPSALHSPFRAVILGVLWALSLWICAPQQAHAYEDQATLSFDLGYAGALAAPDGVPAHGLTVGIGGTLGLGDAWTLGARIGYGAHPESIWMHTLGVDFEIIYMLDILKFVPYVGLGLNAIVLVRGDNAQVDVGLHATLGLDWLLSRRWIVGLEIRPRILPLGLADPGLGIFHLSAGLRISTTFDI